MASVVPVEVPIKGTPEPLEELRPVVEQLAWIVDRLHLRGGDLAGALRAVTQRLVGHPAAILVLGESGDAKSHFVRGLLGGSADLSPVPTAGFACTYLAYGREQECAVVMEHGLTARLPPDQLSDFIAKKGVGGQIRHVLVRSPNPLLKDGLVVIDPPPLTADTEAFLRCTAEARAEADAFVFVMEAGRLCGEATLRFLRTLKGQCGGFRFVLESTGAQMDAGHAVELRLMADALQRYGGIPRPSITVLSSAETPAAVDSDKKRPPLRNAEFHTALLAVARARRQESTCVEVARIANEVLSQAEAVLGTRETFPLRRPKLRREIKPLLELRDLTEALAARSTVFRQAAEAREDGLGNKEQPATRAKETRIPWPPIAGQIPVPSPVPTVENHPDVRPEAPQPAAPPSPAAESLPPASDVLASTGHDTDLGTEPEIGPGAARDEETTLHSDASVAAPEPAGESLSPAFDATASTAATDLGAELNTDASAAQGEATTPQSDIPIAPPEPLHSDASVAVPEPAAENLPPPSDAVTARPTDVGTEPNTDLRAARDEATTPRSDIPIASPEPPHSDVPVAVPEPLHSDVPVAPFPGPEARAFDIPADTGPDNRHIGLGTKPNTDRGAAVNEAAPPHSDTPIVPPKPPHSDAPVVPPEPPRTLQRGAGLAQVARWEEVALQSAAPPERGASRWDPMRVRVRWASNVEPPVSSSRLRLEDLEPERASRIGLVLWLVGLVAVAACAWFFFIRPETSHWTMPAFIWSEISHSKMPAPHSQTSSQGLAPQSASGNISAPPPSIDASSGGIGSSSAPPAINAPSEGLARSSTTNDEQEVNPDGTLQAALTRWASAFRSRDINAQVACYSPHVRTYFNRRNVTRAQIRDDKIRALSRIASIRKYTVAPLSITDEGSDRRVMHVRKDWNTVTTQGTISSGAEIERLVFRRLAGEWKIVDEQEIKGLKLQR